MAGSPSSESTISPPFALLAELTHRCPLHCLYCSNPINLNKQDQELNTENWLNIIQQANDLGIMQIHFSGGEPLERKDLEALVRKAHELDIYSNLITSGVGLSPNRLNKIIEAGISHIQLSIQAYDLETSQLITDTNCLKQKELAAQLIKESQLPFTMNVVLHKLNLDQLDQIIETCWRWGAKRVELANAQYYGFALKNQSYLLPDKSQVEKAYKVFLKYKNKLAQEIDLIWIIPDYFAEFPKPCMDGWGKVQMTIAPDGKVLPCPAASVISTLSFENITSKSLDWIWYHSPSFNAYRGFSWMKEPCQSCPERFVDFGGCRCQAFILTGDASNSDPVCKYSPHNSLIGDAIATSRKAIDENIYYRYLD